MNKVPKLPASWLGIMVGRFIKMGSEITASELALYTGKSKSHISQLVKRGILPAGRKEGRFTYFPRVESILILRAHVENKLWKPRKPRAKKIMEGAFVQIEPAIQATLAPDWSKLL